MTKMKVAPYIPCRSPYKTYYVNQAGGILPVFSGKIRQQGYGFGSLFSGLLRRAVPLAKTAIKTAVKVSKKAAPLIKKATPLAKKTAKAVGKEIVKGGLDVLQDVIKEKKNLKQSAKRRARERVHNVPDIIAANLLTRVKANKRKASQKKSSKAKRLKLTTKDIFD